MTTGTTPPPARTPRSRARTLAPLGLAAWLVLEIWLLTLVAGAAGGLTVLLLLVAGGVLGGAVIKRAGRRAFRTLTETLQRQQGGAPVPGAGADRTGTGNGFLMLGGLLLMLPGLISDVAGLLLLVPAVRTIAGRYAEKALERRMRAVAVPGYGSLGDAFQQTRTHHAGGKVVQGEVIRDEASRQPGAHGDDGPRPPLTR
ncbi:FxsA family membrane protein [Streptomyces sp. NPDC016309]|uniref:FxsA family membrane protein n=1 Tax=Streptomyces sp. NPDC016309 TaxID=3364965 RepID=UPI0036F5064F